MFLLNDGWIDGSMDWYRNDNHIVELRRKYTCLPACLPDWKIYIYKKDIYIYKGKFGLGLGFGFE